MNPSKPRFATRWNVAFSALAISWTMAAGVHADPSLTRSVKVLGEGTAWQTPAFVVESPTAGPTVLVVGGLHGDEPAGAFAADQIRHWTIQRGRLVVVPRANPLGLREQMRWLPGWREDDERRDANTNFPIPGGLDRAQTDPCAQLWALVREQRPDWVIDLRESTDSKSTAGRVAHVGSDPAAVNLGKKLAAGINEGIKGDARFKAVAERGAAPGSLVAAAADRLGAQALVLETVVDGQPMSLRTRQHRRLVGRALIELGMLPAGFPDRMIGDAPDPSLRHVALYDARGAGGQGIPMMTLVAATIPNLQLHYVDGEDVRNGRLRGMHAVIFPGGSASAQGGGLEAAGREQVREFVKQGGGFMGICAGAYLACHHDTKDDRLGIINARHITGTVFYKGRSQQLWHRGESSYVELAVTSTGKGLWGVGNDTLPVRYHNGPVFLAGDRDDQPAYEVIATFNSEISKAPQQVGTMRGAPAVIRSTFGSGRVIAVSPHPETTPEYHNLMARTLAWAAGLPLPPAPEATAVPRTR